MQAAENGAILFRVAWRSRATSISVRNSAMGVRNSCEALPVKVRTLAKALSIRSSIWFNVREKVGDFVFGGRHGQANVEIAIVDAACFFGKIGHGPQRLAAHEVATGAASRITIGVSSSRLLRKLATSTMDLLRFMPVCTE